MLKFSGYPYLIRGQSSEVSRVDWQIATRWLPKRVDSFTTLEVSPDRHCFSNPPRGRRLKTKLRLRGVNDARTGMPPGMPRGAICVQRFDDSLNSAIHITYRISLRSSSMLEPRDPLLKVFTIYVRDSDDTARTEFTGPLAGTGRPRPRGLRTDVRGSSGPAKATKVGRHRVKRRGPKPPGARRAPLCNDPSAGSPTETLLRLLLPLNDRV